MTLVWNMVLNMFLHFRSFDVLNQCFKSELLMYLLL